MAEAPRNQHDDDIPKGLLEQLAGASPDEIRPIEVARARRRAVARAFDNVRVCEEIASQLLLLSTTR
jgi:hypothetical protein